MPSNEAAHHDEQRQDEQRQDAIDVEYGDLLVSGSIYSDLALGNAVEVRRGMAVLTGEGHEAGRVAAVVIASQDQRVTHVLLSRLRQTVEYRLVPIALIEQVHEEQVRLSIFNPVVNSLPKWHGTEPD